MDNHDRMVRAGDNDNNVPPCNPASKSGLPMESLLLETPDDTTGKKLQWAFRKVDATLLLVLVLENTLNSMDRSNLGLSKVVGLERDTGMSGSDFNMVASLMYPTYLVFMLPSNLVLRRLGARIWLSFITVVWGVVNMSMAFARNRNDLIICRLFLGVAESGSSPGGLMLISLWYPRAMITSRISLFYTAFAIGTIIGGPIASGIANIDNTRFSQWGWIFFIEGLFTAGFGLVMFFLLADYPAKSWLLSHEERALIQRRMHEDQVEGGHRKVNMQRLLVHACDPLVYAQALIMFCTGFSGITITLFASIIINQMGYSSSASQAMQAVPGICGLFGILISRHYPKWFGSHYLGTMFSSLWLVGGSTILLVTTNNGARIFALCMMAFGGFGCTAMGPGWLLTNSGGPTRSALGAALSVACIGAASLAASYIYRNKDEPRYLLGHGINLGAGLLAMVTATVAYLIIIQRNKQKEKSPIDITGLTGDEIIDLENDHPDFRYVL